MTQLTFHHLTSASAAAWITNSIRARPSTHLQLFRNLFQRHRRLPRNRCAIPTFFRSPFRRRFRFSFVQPIRCNSAATIPRAFCSRSTSVPPHSDTPPHGLLSVQPTPSERPARPRLPGFAFFRPRTWRAAANSVSMFGTDPFPVSLFGTDPFPNLARRRKLGVNVWD